MALRVASLTEESSSLVRFLLRNLSIVWAIQFFL